jgi:hypothetical protein
VFLILKEYWQPTEASDTRCLSEVNSMILNVSVSRLAQIQATRMALFLLNEQNLNVLNIKGLGKNIS